MRKRRTLRQIEALFEEIDRRGTLETEQRELAKKALKQLQAADQRNDSKAMWKGIDKLISAIID